VNEAILVLTGGLSQRKRMAMPASPFLCRFPPIFTACALAAFLLFAPISGVLFAEVVRIEIKERVLFAGGKAYGTVGPYERIEGRLHLEADPEDPANERIHDLAFAPRNERGKVEYWSDFFILSPVDLSKGNGRVLFDVHNRGNKLALWTFHHGAERSNDPVGEEHGGDGFLFRQGYTLLWCGWNGEVVEDGAKRLLAGLPVAIDAEGKGLTGPAHLEFSVREPTRSREFSWSPWGVGAAYPPLDLDPAASSLTVRRDRDDPGSVVPPDRWAFGRWEDGEFVPDPVSLYLEDGFEPGLLYDLVYTAKDPRVAGLGLAAIRDAVSFFRHAESDAEGAPNPLEGAIDHAYIFGISQSGRVIHHFLYEGLNLDPEGRAVFDGALLHVAGAGKGMFNYRFRMSTEYGSPHEGELSGSEFFPFAPLPQTDPLTGESGSTLARLRESGGVPKMIFVQSSTEYWTRGASLLHTDVEGKEDLELPEEVRVYLAASAQHLGAGSPERGQNQQPGNTLDDRGPILRAMLVALDRWVAEDVAPPPSRYPRIDDGTLVDLETFRAQFPEIPGVGLPQAHYEPARLDFGPRFHSEGVADVIPPERGEPYGTLVPAVDADGNDLAGIRLPEVAAPLATLTGWNLRAAPYGAEGLLSRLDGMGLPFAASEAQRQESGDPRPSLEERYGGREAYLARYTEAALALLREGYLLEEDFARLVGQAADREWPLAD